MSTQELPEFHWPIETREGSWEALEPWSRSLAGVRIEGRRLLLEYGHDRTGRRPPELAHSNFQMLSQFAQLSTGNCAADGRLLRFAAQYGGLGLCKKHGWPMAHQRPHCPQDLSNTRHGFIQREEINGWRYFSRFAHAVVTVLVEPRGAAHDAELKFLNQTGDSDARHAIVRWLTGGELRLAVLNYQPRLNFYGVPPLWTALGLELAALAAGAKGGIVLCSACGRLDTVKRPRPPGDTRRSFCSKCRVRGRKRLGATDLRQRQKQARALHEQGKSVEEIAADLGIEPKRVRNYLAKEK